MEKTLQTLRYLLKSISTGIVIGLIVSLGTVAASDLLFYFTAKYYPLYSKTPLTTVPLTVPFEFTTGIVALLIGLVLFIPDFKVALANGISRKTFLLANLLSAGTAAAAFSIFNLLVVAIHGIFWPITFSSDLLYPKIGWGFLLIWQFALYLLIILAGRLIALAYYRSSALGRWVLSIAPWALLGVWVVANARSEGALRAVLSEYLQWSLWFTRGSPMLLVYSAILCGVAYLLIRRAPLKD